MEKTTTKSLQIAAILASAAIVYNVNTVETEDDWITKQAALLTKEAAILNNEVAQELTKEVKKSSILTENVIKNTSTNKINRKISQNR